MKKFSMKKFEFNKAMKCIKNSLSKDEYRPILKKVKCEVDQESIKFISCNGFSITTFKFKKQQETEPFNFVFDWFKVDEDVQGVMEISFEQIKENEIVCTYQDNNFNQIRKTLCLPNAEYIKYEDVIKGARENIKHKIGFNPKLLQDTLKNHNDIVNISFGDNPAEPIIIESVEKEINCETLSIVLPVRTIEY